MTATAREPMAPEPATLDVARYERAEQMLSQWSVLVCGAAVVPHWIADGSRFWYLSETTTKSFWIVDPLERIREPAFDHARLAEALAVASGDQVEADSLPFTVIEVSAEAVVFDAFGAHWRCALDTYECRVVEGYQPPDLMEVASPDGKWSVVRRDNNLILRSLTSGEERLLTTDGTQERAYGVQPDALSFRMLLRKFGMAGLPPLVSWSPDSRRVITHSLDQRDLPFSHLVESTPADNGRPVLHAYRYAMPGEEAVSRAEFVVFDVDTGSVVPAKTEPMLVPLHSPLVCKRVWWAPDGSAAYYLEQPRDLRTLSLRRIDATTGEVTTLVEESGEPRVEPGQLQMTGTSVVHLLSAGREVLWYSQRDGWGHLYLYDTTSGELRNQVTSGEWLVQAILHVDEQDRVVYFLASGLVTANPYRRQVCRINFDGTGFARLTPDEFDHVVTVAKNGAYYIDSASTVDTPPVITARAWTGEVLVELERADISRLLETGWAPPEEFCVKAADGTTDIYGLVFKPHGMDPEKRYPVIDSPYPGPQLGRLSPAFGGTPFGDRQADALAALGFAVVIVEGRGTPGRSRGFHDLSYGRLSTAGFLEDHVAAFHQLASSHPWMDLQNVGVFGYSGGGYATVRAMCTYPELYRVGVSACGNHDQRFYHLAWGESYDGPFDAATYEASSNVEIAHQLEGKLLLIHGELDDNVHPHLTMRLVDRLIAHNKDFDLLIVPGAEHLFVGYRGYVVRRQWDFFVRHLLHMEPPPGYRIAELPLDQGWLRSMSTGPTGDDA